MKNINQFKLHNWESKSPAVQRLMFNVPIIKTVKSNKMSFFIIHKFINLFTTKIVKIYKKSKTIFEYYTAILRKL